MNTQAPARSTAEPTDETVEEFDVIVIGAGNTGLYQLHLLKKLGYSVRTYDDAAGVGGSWYWNAYPGARFDSESESYVYSFDPEIAQEWDWKEKFSAQPENEKYFNFVADKLDLRDDIVLNTRVEAAVWDETDSRWDVTLSNGRRNRAQFVIMAVGHLSNPYKAKFAGEDQFEGESYHTARWPRQPIDFTGKRVAVIGTGSSGIQVVETIGKQVGHLTVFQRTPNYAVPLRNGLITDEEQQRNKDNADEIFRVCRQDSGTGFVHVPDPRSGRDFTKEERLAAYEEYWQRAGFGKYLAGFSDLLTDREINAEYSEFVRNKIRARIDDPELAEKLLPTEPMGAKRVPCETGYYEVFNQDNVELVSVRETPIERITSKGIETSEGEREFDVIVYATGFDAFSGSFTNMDIRGIDQQTIQDKMSTGLRTLLGVQTYGFPNLFISISFSLCNHTVCAEMISEWVTECIEHVKRSNASSIQPRKEAEEAWVEHVIDVAKDNVLHDAETNWFTGSNIPGKPSSIPLVYVRGVQDFRHELEEAAETYEDFIVK